MTATSLTSDDTALDTPSLSAGGPANSRKTFSIFVLHPSMLLTDHRPSGDGLLAFEFLSRLASRGHRIHVAVSLQSIQGALPPNLHLHDIPTRTTASPFGASLANRIEFGLRAGALLRRLQQQESFDVVHQLNPVVYGLSHLAAIRDIPLVMGPIPLAWPRGAEHGNTLRRRIIDAVRIPLMARQFRLAKRILAASPSLPDQLQLDDDNRARVRTLPFGVDPVKFAPPSPEEEPRTPTILFLANLWRRKGIFTLLDAFCIVHSVLPDARLVIAGDGSDAEEIRAQAAAHPAAQHIEMIGMVPRSRVPDILRTCSVYCLPSFGEPFGMSALEAMSCGRPFVGTDAGGLRHIVSPDGGILVPVGNPDALAGALLRILTEPGLAAHMGKENVRHVKGNFAWDTVIDRLEDLYAELAPVGRVPQESAKVASRQMPMAAKSLPLRP